MTGVNIVKKKRPRHFQCETNKGCHQHNLYKIALEKKSIYPARSFRDVPLRGLQRPEQRSGGGGEPMATPSI